MDLSVKFEKEGCVITNNLKEILMQGTRSSDNCYLWSPDVTTDVATSKCLLSKDDETKLWHKRLGHLNLRSMNNLISKQAITGVPDLKIEEGKIFGECQIGKKV